MKRLFIYLFVCLYVNEYFFFNKQKTERVQDFTRKNKIVANHESLLNIIAYFKYAQKIISRYYCILQFLYKRVQFIFLKEQEEILMKN